MSKVWYQTDKQVMNIDAKNRCRRARKNVGLSLCQAARLLGVTVADLTAAEFAGPWHNCSADRLADFYGVTVEWLTGEVPLRDYAAVDRIPGGRELPFCDRDAVAELLAALPRRAS